MALDLHQREGSDHIGRSQFGPQRVFVLHFSEGCCRGRVNGRSSHQNGGSAHFAEPLVKAAKERELGIALQLQQRVLR